MVDEITEVWVTLRGEKAHVRAECTGISDGHAKAVREGRNTFPAELWPVQFALTGGEGLPARGRCRVCWPDAAPVALRDNRVDVAAAQRGRIARALRQPPVHEPDFGLDTAPQPQTWNEVSEAEEDAGAYLTVFGELMTSDDIEDDRLGGRPQES